jgi:replication-associated recombination protein RarA
VSGPPPTRHGRSPYLIVSALQKAIRRGQVEPAAAFALELTSSGFGAWCFARLKTIACEDCNPAPGVIADIEALHQQWKAAGGKGDLHWLPPVRAAVVLALAPKSRLVDWLIMEHAGKDAPPMPVPDEAHDMHTAEGKRMGRGKRHFAEEAGRLVEFDGNLAALEADLRERALARWMGGDQMTLTGEEDR